MKDNDKLINDYQGLVNTLLAWIQKTTVELSDRKFPNTISEVQTLVVEFNQFRTVVKPPKYVVVVFELVCVCIYVQVCVYVCAVKTCLYVHWCRHTYV